MVRSSTVGVLRSRAGNGGSRRTPLQLRSSVRKRGLERLDCTGTCRKRGSPARARCKKKARPYGEAPGKAHPYEDLSEKGTPRRTGSRCAAGRGRGRGDPAATAGGWVWGGPPPAGGVRRTAPERAGGPIAEEGVTGMSPDMPATSLEELSVRLYGPRAAPGSTNRGNFSRTTEKRQTSTVSRLRPVAVTTSNRSILSSGSAAAPCM